jgi:hypothetical protein
MAKHMFTDHEELYMNLLKPQMKLGNELVAQVSNKKRVNTLIQTLSQCQMYKIYTTGFKLKLTRNDIKTVKRLIEFY